MKKKHLIVLGIIAFTLLGNAQNKLKDDQAFQKTIQFRSDISKEAAISFFAKQNGLDASYTFVETQETSDESGLIHQRHQQYYKGIKIEYGTLITHSRNGNVVSINGEIYDAHNLDLSPTITAEQGLGKATDNIKATKYLWQDKEQSAIVGYEKPTGSLVIFPVVKTGEIKLAYKYDIYAVEPLSRQEVYVDAHNGAVLFKNAVIKHVGNVIDGPNSGVKAETALVTGNANTKYSGARSIETRFDTPLNMFVLNDQTRGANIVTYNCERIVNTYQNVHFKDNDNNWTTAEHNNTFLDNAAQDAHWGAEMTYDFWKNIFNRNSYDGNNGQIKSYVHYKQTAANFNNAFWNGSFMTYGDGTNSKPFTPIDICGHEIGHAITQYTANLVYKNQSGALNEAYSDIYGACIEHYGRTGSLAGTPVANVWKIGEDIVNPCLRVMNTPTVLGDPDTYRGTNWYTTGDDGPCSPTDSNDQCGVHTNSGVINHWFYILSIGKAGTNNAPAGETDTYNVTGIGIAKAVQIAYYAERDYLTPNATFFDARDATITVARNLYCTSGQEVVSVTNAWFAVNVGDSFIATPNDVNLKSVSATSANCGVTSVSPIVTFENLGTNPITTVTIAYNIDGGTNTTYIWSGSLSTCSVGTYQPVINTSSLSVGRHIVNFTTSITNDGNLINNTRSVYVFVNQSAGLNQINTFEAASDDLIAYDDVVAATSLWARGTSNKSVLTNAVAGSNVYATNLTGFYTNATKSYLMSRCYDLSTASNPILKFDMAFDLEYGADILYLQYSTDGGINWNLLGSAANTNWYNSNSGCPNCLAAEWTGGADNSSASGLTNGTKQQYLYDLSAFGAGSPSPQSNMIFRFVFHSDATENNYDGAIIDNFVVETALGTNQNQLSDLAVYPNPTNDNITVSFHSNSTDTVNLAVYDVQGRLIKSNAAAAIIGSFDYTLNLATLPTGVYVLKISQGDLNYNTKVIRK